MIILMKPKEKLVYAQIVICSAKEEFRNLNWNSFRFKLELDIVTGCVFYARNLRKSLFTYPTGP